MNEHRYSPEDKVFLNSDRILYPAGSLNDGYNERLPPLPVVIVAQIPHEPDRFSDVPVYFVRALTASPARERFRCPESLLEPKPREIYEHKPKQFSEGTADIFVKRCREIEPVEVIDGRVQPLSQNTISRVTAWMARERADVRRTEAKRIAYNKYLSAPLEAAI